MKLLKILIVFSLVSSNLFGQDIITVRYHYDNSKIKTKLDSVFYNINKTIFISLDDGFNDSLIVTVNDLPVLNQYLKTNESIGLAGSFEIHFSDSSEIKILRLNFIKASCYIVEKINLNYKSLIINKVGSWQFYYSNHFFMRE